MRGQTPTKKELVNVGGRPIIWHVMRIFSAHGFNNYILTLGYGADQLKRYFLNYDAMSRDFDLNLGDQTEAPRVSFHAPTRHPGWKVVMVDTGLHTAKASRVAKVRQHLAASRFFVAYGDDVSDVDLGALLAFHLEHGRMATITAVQIRLPYGVVQANEDGLVEGFVERPLLERWINGGFMLFEKAALDLMANGEDVDLENDVLPELARMGQLMIYRHRGFWQSMNTMKDNLILEELWQKGAPWKVW
jgi:glucose-1-phosphate cytidylyltransferase